MSTHNNNRAQRLIIFVYYLAQCVCVWEREKESRVDKRQKNSPIPKLPRKLDHSPVRLHNFAFASCSAQVLKLYLEAWQRYRCANNNKPTASAQTKRNSNERTEKPWCLRCGTTQLQIYYRFGGKYNYYAALPLAVAYANIVLECFTSRSDGIEIV